MALEDSVEQLIRTLKKQTQESSGAAATEEKRDNARFQKKQVSLLERIAKAVGDPVKAVSEASPGAQAGMGMGLAVGAGGILAKITSAIGGGIKGGISGLYKGAAKAFTSPAMVKMMGPAAIAAGIGMMVADGMKGMKKAKEWDVSKMSAGLGGAIGGTKSGWEGAMANAGKWAITGAGIGFMVGGPIGAAAGGVLGGAIGAVLGFIGGKKIAEFFDGVGKWASEKWDIIKAFPGKIWDAIVGTVKGWLGLGGKEEVPVTTDEPKKGWLDSIIDFIIPQWLRDFAKDAIGTVTGWLGLTEKDDQGKITTTAFGKLVFGTIGAIKDFAMKIIGYFIPQFVKDFVASPLTTVLTWIGIKEKDEETGEVTSTAFGKKLFGTVGEIVDMFKSIIISVIGQPTYDAIIGFATNPIDYVLVNVLGWKKDGEATQAGLEAVKVMEEEGFLSFTKTIIKKIIGENNVIR